MFTATLYAQGTQAQAGNPLVSIGMMVAIFAIFYFLLIRPQRQQQKKLAQAIENVKKGDKVIIAGGIIAEYFADKDGGRIAVVKLGENTKIEIIKSSISAVVTEEQLNAATTENKKENKKEESNKIKEDLEKAQKEEEKKSE